MPNSKKRNKIIAFCACFILLGSFLIFLIPCVSFSQCFFDGVPGECISVAFFEKQKMRTVDKVVLNMLVGKERKSVTVTDKDLIREITKEVTVATRTDLRVAPTGSIDLYSKDELVRSMRWSIGAQLVAVYQEDLTHWLITPNIFHFCEENNDVGVVTLSDELADKLNALLEEAPTQTPD